MPVALAAQGTFVLLAVGMALRLWPSYDPEIIAHSHSDLPKARPHLRDHAGSEHAHLFVIDNLHRRWPI